MSGDGKRGDGHRPPATAPIFDSTRRDDCLSWRVGRHAGVKLTLANNCRISAVDRWRHPAERKPPRLLLKDSTKGICTAARARVGGHPPRRRTTVFARSAEPLAECPGSSRCECCGICHNAEACLLVACNRLAQLLNVLLAKAQRAVQTSSQHMVRVGQIEADAESATAGVEHAIDNGYRTV